MCDATTSPPVARAESRGRPAAPVLTSVWLDADRSTYETLCTAGAAAITVAVHTDTEGVEEEQRKGHLRSSLSLTPTTQNGIKDGADAHVRSSASPPLPSLSTVQRLIPHENWTRKRLRGHSADRGNVKSEETRDSLAGHGIRRSNALSAECIPMSLLPGDADARLDVLEEVELCSVVPRLPRTFGIEQLVQQVVPCTAFMPRSNETEGGEDSVPSRSGTRRCCLTQLRDAADQHAAMLRALGGSASHLVSAHEDLHGAKETGACKGSTKMPRLPCRCVSQWLPLVPACMRGTSLEARESHIDDSGHGRGRCGSGDVSASSATPSPHASLLDDSCASSVDVCEVDALVPPSSDFSPNGTVMLNIGGRGGEGNNVVLNPLGAVANEVAEARGVTAKEDIKVPLETRDSSGVELAWPPAVPSSVEAEKVEHQRDSDFNGLNGACFSFAEAQALYEVQRQERAVATHVSRFPQHRVAKRGVPSSTQPPTSFNTAVNTDASRACALERSESTTEVGPAPMPAAGATSASASGTAAGAETLRVSLQSSSPATTRPTPTEATKRAASEATRMSVASHPSLEAEKGEMGISATTAARFWSSTAAHFAPGPPPEPFPHAGAAISLSLEDSLPDCPPHHLATNRDNNRWREEAFATARPTSAQSHARCVAQPAGALVEWASGRVSYTADTEGLMQEQHARGQRFLCFPPPLPTAAPTPQSDSNSNNKREKKAAPSEERSTLRGAVLTQLQRLQRHSEAVAASCHGVSHASGSVPSSSAHAHGMTAGSEGAQLSGNDPRKACASRAVTPTTSSLSCPCLHCSPLQLQFAQVPSMASATLRRYLEVLHQTALPSLQHPYPSPRRPRTSVADGGLHDAAAQSTSKARRGVPASPPAADNINHHHEHPQSHQREKKGEVVDAIDVVFPALHKLFVQPNASDVAEGQQGNTHKEEEKLEEEAGHRWGSLASLPRRPAARMSRAADLDKKSEGNDDATHLRDLEVEARTNCFAGAQSSWANTANGGSSPSAATSLGWIDDAVLDEAVVVGLVPRGQPHQLRLVAPSRAFALALVQRLEEVVEVALRVLANISFPVNKGAELRAASSSSTSPASSLSLEKQTPTATTTIHTKRNRENKDIAAMSRQWQAWLEEVYLVQLWRTLHDELSGSEWCMVVQQAEALPFLPSPSALSSPARTSLSGGVEPRLPASLANFFAAEEGAEDEDAPLEMKRDVASAAGAVVRRVECSVRAAATTHVSACVSAAEDATARVILTALTPLLHRRITVMYELLRHFASKSLYASHRAQCESYQQWYATTPSPAAVLRLLQRSRRLRGALARCYPQYSLLPAAPSLPPQPQGHGSAAMEEPGAARGFPTRPLASTTSSHVAPETSSPAPTDKTQSNFPHQRHRSEDEEGCVAKVGQLASKTEKEGEAVMQAVLHPPLVPLPISSDPAHASASSSSSAIPWSPVPVYPVSSPQDTDVPSPSTSETATTPPPPPTPAATAAAVAAERASSPSLPIRDSPSVGASGAAPLLYVPEVALLDPRYLQRFAWWTHRTHHGNNSSSHSHNSHSGTAVSFAAQNPVMSIPGDYLRVLPLQEQDAAIRAVLRSIAQKGRTLDLWEMAQYMQAHRTTPYIYH